MRTFYLQRAPADPGCEVDSGRQFIDVQLHEGCFELARCEASNWSAARLMPGMQPKTAATAVAAACQTVAPRKKPAQIDPGQALSDLANCLDVIEYAATADRRPGVQGKAPVDTEVILTCILQRTAAAKVMLAQFRQASTART